MKSSQSPLAHFPLSIPRTSLPIFLKVFTVQSNATQLTTLCADERGYMSNISSLLFSLPFIFVLDRSGGGRVRCFCLGISEGSCINPFQEVGGPRLFSPKNSKIPRAHPRPPPPPSPTIKNVPSLKAKKIYGAPLKPSELFCFKDTRFHCVTIFLSDMQ